MATQSVPQDSLLIHDVDAGSCILRDSGTNALFDDI